MRTFLLISNAAVALLFAAFFAYTFLSRQQLDAMAREFVTAKTQSFITPAVDAAEGALRSDITRRLLSQTQVAAIEAEVADFRSQPTHYIQRLTSAHAPPKPEPTLSKLPEKIFGWKERIRMHYSNVLQRLFTDLRIFSGTNVIAACIAFAFAWRSPRQISRQLIRISGLLLAAVGLGIYLYIDDFSFFTILFDCYLGWSYPSIIGTLFFRMHSKYGSRRTTDKAAPTSAPARRAVP